MFFGLRQIRQTRRAALKTTISLVTVASASKVTIPFCWSKLFSRCCRDPLRSGLLVSHAQARDTNRVRTYLPFKDHMKSQPAGEPTVQLNLNVFLLCSSSNLDVAIRFWFDRAVVISLFFLTTLESKAAKALVSERRQ